MTERQIDSTQTQQEFDADELGTLSAIAQEL